VAQVGPERANGRDLRRYLENTEGISPHDVDSIFADARDIFSRCVEPGQVGQAKGLIYGLIQSGKTAVIIALMAVAADNGYRQFVVLTTNLNDLYEQTLDRIKRSLDGFAVVGKREILRLQPAVRNAPLVMVASKGTPVLRKVKDAVDRVGWAGNTTMIIDDEADQASLNTQTNLPLRPPSGVNRELTELRQKFASLSYVQTTATPQALLLQDETAAFHPDFVTVTTPGTGYCGGDVFFLDEDFNQPTYLSFVPTIDVQNLVRTNQIPDTVAESLATFFVSAAILRLLGSAKNFTYLLHTSFRQADHRLATGLVDDFRNQFALEATIAVRAGEGTADQAMVTLIHIAYDRLANGFPHRPEFADVLREIAHAIASTEVIEINSSTGEGVSPNPSRRHTIYVGGTKIGRGVTVKNLLVTYYGRDARYPQVDTVLQHARMYGYRQAELPAIRIYLPLPLAVRFRDIHVADNAYRDLAGANHVPIPVIQIPGAMRPTRRNVLNVQTVELSTYVAGSQYFPLLPVSDPARLGNQTDEITRLLNAYPETRHSYEISIEQMLGLLDFQYGELGGPGAWNDDLIRQAMRLLREADGQDGGACLVIPSRDSNIGKNDARGATQVGAVLPGGTTSLTQYGVDPRKPAIAMIRVLGARDKQWEGSPFWLPLVRFPNGNYAYALNRGP
jgi:hypothetical protein